MEAKKMKKAVIVGSIIIVASVLASIVFFGGCTTNINVDQSATTTTTTTSSTTSTIIPSTSYTFSWKSNSFNSILDVAFDNTDNLLYLTDQAGDKIYKLNKNNGSIINYFTESFRAPLYMTFNSAGNLLVTDNQHGKIKIFDDSDTLIGSIEGLSDPNGIAINSEGKIYVVNSTGGIISIYSSSGSFESSFGGITTSNEDGKFTRCSYGNAAGDVVIDSEDNVYVTDLGRRIIHKFTKNGSFILSFGSFTSSNYLHFGICIDNYNYIFASDVGAGKIKKYYKDGSYICEFGSSGSGDGQLNIPIGIDTDGAGNVYIGDAGNHRVQCFAPSN